MKAIYSIGADLGGGGIGNTAGFAAEGLYKLGAIYRVICLKNKQNLIPPNFIRQISWIKYSIVYPARILQKYFFKRFNSYYFTDRVYDFFAKKYVDKCDIFHYWKNHGESCATKARKLGAKIFVENASLYPMEHKKIIDEEYKRRGLKKVVPLKEIEQQIREINFADYVVVPKGGAYESFIKNGFDPKKIVPVSFGVPTREGNNKKIKNTNKFTAIYVGQVSLSKGVLYLLEAWEKLHLKGAELLIIGGISEEIKPFIEEYRKNTTIKFLGYRNPKEYYQRSDLFVFPSLSEGSALVTYEALNYGLPQIVTKNSGSVIMDGKEGFIVPIKDSGALANKVKYLYNHPEIRRKMSDNAIRLSRKYPWENYSKQLFEAYGRAL